MMWTRKFYQEKQKGKKVLLSFLPDYFPSLLFKFSLFYLLFLVQMQNRRFFLLEEIEDLARRFF